MEPEFRYNLELDMDFDSAHYLPGYVGKCANKHGHCWRIVIGVSTVELDDQSMVVDFKSIKDEVNKLDHQLLNEFISMPTAENIAAYIFRKIANLLKGSHSEIKYIKVFESKGASITVMRESM